MIKRGRQYAARTAHHLLSTKQFFLSDPRYNNTITHKDMVTIGNILTVNSHGALGCIVAWQGGVLTIVLSLGKVVY